jgi:calcineurin-like phosphoesterase family protein
MAPHQRGRRQQLARRDFLRGSAAIAVSLVAPSGALTAAARAASLGVESGLLLPPFLARPTETSIHISAMTSETAAEATVELRPVGKPDWERPQPTLKVSSYEMLDWDIHDLSPATRYEYRVLLKQGADESLRPTATGSFTTQRKRPANYTVVLMTDPHVGYFPSGSKPALTLDQVVANAARAPAEFVLDLGDNVAWRGSREHPQTNTDGALSAYARYRKQIGPLSNHCPHFAVIGNWAGESGKFPKESIQMTAAVRHRLLPGPNDRTYPQGGSAGEDYYAFTWGDALYVILNIQTYTKPSKPDELPSLMVDVNGIEDWTLGERQMQWFETTLKNATERFRFVCMHHAAGGNAGDPSNTLYGRGGARACHTGEQARIHALMKKHHVQVFFYGHDHVFVDDVVDGIHYTLPGSCGAPWKFNKEETGYERSWADSGHAQLDVTPEKATVTFINLEGKTLHSFSVLPA